MSKIREAMARELAGIDGYEWWKLADGYIEGVKNREYYRQNADQILAIREDGLRLAVVKEKGELPENPYFPRFYDQGRGYEQGQADMLGAHYVREVL